MKKKLFSLLIILCLLFATGCFNNKKIETDAMKFKKEYESLNGEVIGNSKYKYPTVEISEDNPIKYANYDEVLQLLEDGSGVIYLGYESCPWCRNAAPVLLEAAEEVGLEEILYINMKEERDEIKVKEDGSLEVVKEGSEGYKKLLKRLDPILDEYILEDVHGNKVSANEKRIFVPLVIFVHEGDIVAYHVDTVSSQVNPFEKLNEEQINELINIYVNYMHKALGDVCDSSC